MYKSNKSNRIYIHLVNIFSLYIFIYKSTIKYIKKNLIDTIDNKHYNTTEKY